MRPYLHTQRTHEMHFLETPKSPIQSHSPISRRSGSATAVPLVAAPSPRLFSRDAPARLDVVAMAKAWTGHNIIGWVTDYNDTTYRFYPTKHDNTNKSLFGGSSSLLYGAQPRNWNALETIEELVFGLKQADTARYVARKMYKFFIGDSPSDAAVQDLATAWIAGGMEIAALVQATLLHADFWAAESRYAIVRSPIDWIVATLRRTGYRFKVNSAEGRNFIDGMGQVPFDPPNVAGWKMNGYWLSTATAWARGNFSSWMRRIT